MRRFACALVAVTLAAALVRAQDETYTIKLKEHPGKGQVTKVTEKFREVTKFKVTGEDGKVVEEGEKVKGREQAFTEKILAVGEKAPSKVERTYGKASETFDRKTFTAPHQGRTITFTFAEGKARAVPAGDPPLPEKLLTVLAGQAGEQLSRRKEALVPKKPVKVGESWTVSGKQAASFIGVPASQADRVKGKGKLLKAYKKGGKQWGTLELTFQVPIPSKDRTVMATTTLTVDTAIDASSTDARVKFAMKVPLTKRVVEQRGKKYTVETSGTITGTSGRTETE
jgi:hypothetical protein